MNEMKPEDVMRKHTEDEIIKAWEDEVALGKEVGLKRDFINYVSISLVNDTLSLLREKDAEIERLTKERDLANAEREANVKGFTEELQNTIDRYKGVIRILEQDVADRDKLLDGKVEAAYSEFMRDYKQLQEEYNDLAVQIVDEFAAKIKERMGEASPGHIYDRDVDEVARDLKEDLK